MKRVLVLLALAGLLVGCGGQSQTSQKKEVEKAEVALVALYCLYGSQSEVQFDGCLHHVNPAWVGQAQTPAARWARGERHTCGPTSGPRCSHREWLRFVRIVEHGGQP